MAVIFAPESDYEISLDVAVATVNSPFAKTDPSDMESPIDEFADGPAAAGRAAAGRARLPTPIQLPPIQFAPEPDASPTPH